VAIALFILLAVFTWAIREGFQIAADPAISPSDECGLRSSCSSCLEPIREIAATDGADCEKKSGEVVKKANGTYDKCRRRAKCGWCASANKCVPRTDSGFPVVPMVNDSNGKSTGMPQFACPVEAPTGGRNFVTRKEDCADFQCSTIKNCRDCAQAQRCGWVDNGADSVCGERAAVGGASAAASVTVPAGKTFVTTAATCPARACDQITDCAECATTPNCGFCEVKKKCLRLSRPPGDTTPLEKCEKVETVSGQEVKTPQVAIISRTQCPAERADTTLTQRSEQSDYKASAGELAKIQDDLLDGNEAAPAGAVQTVPATGGAVSPPAMKDSVGAPGVSRLLGSGGSVSGSWPAAASLDGQGGAFESYVQMLVKSELAGQGIRTNEPFKSTALSGQGLRASVGGARAEPFSVKDVIRNAGKVLQGI
jgi:hypothetical protein